MTRVIAVEGKHIKKLEKEYTLKDKVKAFLSATGELAAETAVSIADAATGAYELASDIKKNVNGTAYSGKHEMSVGEENLNNNPINSEQTVMEMPDHEKEALLEETIREYSSIEPEVKSNADELSQIPNEIDLSDKIVSEEEQKLLDDNSLLSQAFYNMLNAKYTFDFAKNILREIMKTSESKWLNPDEKNSEIAKQKANIQSAYEKYLIEEARFDILKERMLIDMKQNVDSIENPILDSEEVTNEVVASDDSKIIPFPLSEQNKEQEHMMTM